MIALDTNVIVRYLVADDAEQSRLARSLIDRALGEGAQLVVSDAVLCEIAWVLESCYGTPRAAIAGALGRLLASEQLVVEAREGALNAVRAYRDGAADFADYLIRERAWAAGAAAVATFDAGALTEPGFVPPDATDWPGELSLHERPPSSRWARR